MRTSASELQLNGLPRNGITGSIMTPFLHVNRKWGLKYRFDYIRNYVAMFGPLLGMRTYRSLHRATNTAEAVEVRVPNIPFPISVRPGTADSSTFDSVFVWKQYQIPFPGKVDTIFDCGANIGLSSVWFASVCPTAKIVAFEPQMDNFNLLRKNSRPYKNIIPSRCAVWNKTTELSLCDSNARVDSYQYEEGKREVPETVAAFDLTTLMSQSGVCSIDILKIDIEGAEAEVFGQGCHKWLDRVRMIIVEIHSVEARQTVEKAIANSAHSWHHTVHGENDVFVRQA